MCVCVRADPFTRPNKKHQERMAALQERRQSLQALLNTRLAELRRICLQEAVSADVLIIRNDLNCTRCSKSVFAASAFVRS